MLMPCGVMEIAQLLLGAMQIVAATVPQFKISSGVFSRCRRQDMHLLRFWQMDQLSPGGSMQIVAVTVLQFKISSGVCSRFRRHICAFAAILADGSVVTWGHADCGGDSSAVQDQLRGVQQIQATSRICCDFGRWISCHLGWCSSWRWQFMQFKISSGVCSRFRRQRYAFAAILADGSVVTWGDRSSWRWQFRSSRSAQGCAADSGHCVSHLLRFWQMDQSSPGVMQHVAVTVLLFKISSEVCSRFRPHFAHLLRSWRMDQLSPGVVQIVAVTVPQFKISSGVCSRFRPHVSHLLRFWQMDQLSPGVMQIVAVTVPQFEISSGVCSRFRPHFAHLLRFWQMDQLSPGVVWIWTWISVVLSVACLAESCQIGVAHFLQNGETFLSIKFCS